MTDRGSISPAYSRHRAAVWHNRKSVCCIKHVTRRVQKERRHPEQTLPAIHHDGYVHSTHSTAPEGFSRKNVSMSDEW